MIISGACRWKKMRVSTGRGHVYAMLKSNSKKKTQHKISLETFIRCMENRRLTGESTPM
jgi:hypothetical protein